MTETIDRTQFIGGSDIPALLGLSRYKTPLALWAEKSGQIPSIDKPSLRMRVGMKMEEIIAELWMEETGKTLQRVTERKVHPKYPYFKAQIDRLVVGEDATWEGKNTNWRLKKDWENGEVPQEALIQAMWGLAVTGKKSTYVCGLIDNEDLRWVKIDRDPVMIAEMLKRADAFWNEFVLPKVMPAQISDKDTQTLLALFPQAEVGKEIQLNDDAAKLCELRASSYSDLIALEKQVQGLENQLKALVKESEVGIAGNYRISWKNISRKAYEVKASTYRKFDVKEIKEEAHGNSK